MSGMTANTPAMPPGPIFRETPFGTVTYVAAPPIRRPACGSFGCARGGAGGGAWAAAGAAESAPTTEAAQSARMTTCPMVRFITRILLLRLDGNTARVALSRALEVSCESIQQCYSRQSWHLP